MAIENNDFERINHIYISGKELKLDRENNGPAGRMNLGGMDGVLNQLRVFWERRPKPKRSYPYSEGRIGDIRHWRRPPGTLYTGCWENMGCLFWTGMILT